MGNHDLTNKKKLHMILIYRQCGINKRDVSQM